MSDLPDTVPASPTDIVHLVPLAEIDAAAIPRDRTGLDEGPQTELELSIAASGLRQPIELFPLAEPLPQPDPQPNPALRYGLLSGYHCIPIVP